MRILYSEGKYSFAPKKFIKSLAAAAGGGGGGGDEMKSCLDLWGGGLSLPLIYVWLETSAVQWCHLETGSALCKVSLHSQPQAQGEHCLPSIVVSPIVRVAVLLQENSYNNATRPEPGPYPDSSSHMRKWARIQGLPEPSARHYLPHNIF